MQTEEIWVLGRLSPVPLSSYMCFPCVAILGSHVFFRDSCSTNHNLSLFFIYIFITWVRVPSASGEGSDAEGQG